MPPVRRRKFKPRLSKQAFIILTLRKIELRIQRHNEEILRENEEREPKKDVIDNLVVKRYNAINDLEQLYGLFVKGKDMSWSMLDYYFAWARHEKDEYSAIDDKYANKLIVCQMHKESAAAVNSFTGGVYCQRHPV